MTMYSVVSLLYHSVFQAMDSNETYDIPLNSFKEHINIIKTRDCRCVTADDLMNLEGAGIKSGTHVILTFDDGSRNHHEIVFPVLAERAIQAMFFVNPARVGTAGYMDWTQLAELDRYGMSVQSHGLTHRYLHLLSSQELELELRKSKMAIEERIGKRVDFLSVPGGFFSRKVVESAWNEGYRGIFTSDPGIDRIGRPGRNIIFHRYNITRNTLLVDIEDLLSKKLSIRLRYHATHSIKCGIKKVLGTKAYHWIWTNLRKYSR